MIEANNSQTFQQHSAWPFPKPNCMGTSLEQRQPECFSASVNLSTNMISARSPVSGFTNPDVNPESHMVPLNPLMPAPEIPSWKMDQGFEYQGMIHNSFPSFPTFAPSTKLHQWGKQTGFPQGANGKIVKDTFFESLPKAFLVFDKPGSQTQLICHAICTSAHYATAVSAKQACDLDLLEKQAGREGLLAVEQSSIPEERNERQINVEESRTHEDTEELNALLYSDEADDDSCDEDDDIISTGHSPAILEGNYEEVEQFEGIMERVASLDQPNKRQKQLNGGYTKPLLMDSVNSDNLKCHRKHDIDAESHTSRRIQREEMGNMSGKKHQKTVNIRKMLRVLESIVPGAKGKDPFLVLDESIKYLKSLKVEANSLGVYPLEMALTLPSPSMPGSFMNLKSNH